MSIPRSATYILGNPLAGLPGLTPLAYSEFNEGSGGTANDSSVNVRTGTFSGATYQPGRTGTATDYSLNFTAASQRVTVAIAGTGGFNAIGTNNQVTVSLWVNGDVAAQPHGNVTFSGLNGGNRIAYFHLPYSDSNVYWDSGNAGCCGTNVRLQTALTRNSREPGTITSS